MGPRPLIFAVLLCAAAAACGPRPRVEGASVRRLADGRLLVDVSVGNRGGEGEASVTVRLTDRATGRVFVKERGVALANGKPASAAIEVNAPAADYELAAEVRFPP